MGREGEVTDAVAAKLQFETVIRGVPFLRSHDPSVVDQEANWASLIAKAFTEFRHTAERSEIDFPDADLGIGSLRQYLRDGCQTLLFIANSHDDFSARFHEAPGQTKA